MTNTPEQIDISNLDVPMTLTVAEINYTLGAIGDRPYAQVAGLIAKIKGQAEQYIASNHAATQSSEAVVEDVQSLQ